jgi:hypothetical protein
MGSAGSANADKGKRLFEYTWFGTAVCLFVVSSGAVKGMCQAGEPVNIVETLYLAFFSLILIVENMRFCKENDTVEFLKETVNKYLGALDRYFFKGLSFVYIGASLISFYWHEIIGNASISWIGTAVGLFAVLVGILTSARGLVMTFKLHSLKSIIQNDANFPLQYFEPQTDAGAFRRFAEKRAQLRLDQVELMQIFKGLCSQLPAHRISHQDFEDWKASQWYTML